MGGTKGCDLRATGNRVRKGLDSGLIVAAAALFVLVALTFLGMRLTQGHWVYTLDDAYIHMAMARTLALHGVWGVSPEAFGSCSSSPLWTLLLAVLFKVVGVRDWLPGMLNTVCVLMTLWVIDRTLLEQCVPRLLRVISGLAIFFLAPLTVIASTGMEHCLHVLLTVVFVRAALGEFNEAEAVGNWARGVTLAGWAFLMTATRFESLFVVAPVASVFVLRGRWRIGCLVLLSAMLPVVAYGVFSLAHGGMFLPNSVMLKGHFPGGGIGCYVQQLCSMYVRVSLVNVHVHVLCLALLLTACCRRFAQNIRLLALAVVAACICQVTFSECGRFYRYETFLMTSGLLLLASAWLPMWEEYRGAWAKPLLGGTDGWLVASRLALVLFLSVPLCLRGFWATSRIVRASANIYQQQWQLARIFDSMDVADTRVAVNDLGLMSYRSGVKLIDLWGLGTMDIARLKWTGRYDQKAIADLLVRNRVGYVVVFDQWFAVGRELPGSLILVARLRHRKNIVCLQDTVMLYATDFEAAERLRKHLRHLPFSLPQETTLEWVF